MDIEAIERQQLYEQLRDIWQDLDTLEFAYNTQKIAFFEPIGKQAEASHALNTKGTKVVLVLGSNRSGKSVWGHNEAYAHSQGYRPWLDKDHPDYIVRLSNGNPIPVPNVGRIIAQNYQQAVQQTIYPKILEWAPKGTYKTKNDNRGIPVKVNFDNGSEIFLMSNDQDDMAFEGTSGHWVWADEPIDYKKYIALKRGLIDFSGHLWMTMTPLSQPWVHDIIVKRANDADGRVRLFKFSIWDNCVENGGYLQREDIEEFLEDCREDELEARLHGNFLFLAGRVYKEWEPEAPFWVEKHDIPRHWPRVCIIDPHSRKPMAVLWIAITPDNEYIVYRDLFDKKLNTVEKVADRIKFLEGWTYVKSTEQWVRGPEAEPVACRLIDNSARQNEPTSGDTIHRRFATHKIFCQLANKQNAEAGYDAIHDALELKYEWSEPTLIVFNTCKNVKDNFLNFCYDDWVSSKQTELKGDKEGYRKTRDDFIDCIRYCFQTGITYQMLKRESKKIAEYDPDDLFNGTGMLTGKPARERNKQWQMSSKVNRSPYLRSDSIMAHTSTRHGLRMRKSTRTTRVDD